MALKKASFSLREDLTRLVYWMQFTPLLDRASRAYSLGLAGAAICLEAAARLDELAADLVDGSATMSNKGSGQTMLTSLALRTRQYGRRQYQRLEHGCRSMTMTAMFSWHSWKAGRHFHADIWIMISPPARGCHVLVESE